jgi:hypothetical protein
MRPTIFALALALLGCGKEKPLSIESEPATAPSASKWRRATVSMIFEQGHGNYTKRIRYWLKLSGPAGEHTSTLEEVFGPSGIANTPMEVTAEELEALKKTKPRVAMAPDGHALAFSRDGHLYRYVALDAGEQPLYCAHLAFEPDSSGDALAAAPTTRDLALAILRTKGTSGAPHYPKAHAVWSSAFESEALGAIDYACAHQEDADLRAALVSAKKRFADFANTVVTERLAACAKD